MSDILVLFIVLRVIKFLLEYALAAMNRRYYHAPENQQEACRALKIPSEDFAKTLSYTDAKYRLHSVNGIVQLLVSLGFLAWGGFGLVEAKASELSSQMGQGTIVTGLIFFGFLSLLSMLVSLPFDYYGIFVVEERFGFNRQSLGSFVGDRIKGLLLGGILGGGLLAGPLWVMEASGPNWWLWAWGLVSLFSLLTSWLYPSLLAPLFNKFSPLGEGELKTQIYRLAEKINFRTSGIYIMDASKRSSHGNAYFTGVFGEKRIVLFDTLVESMSAQEIVAVLAHELGHFKLNHVRWGLLRAVAMTGLLFYGLSLCLPLASFYEAFSLHGVSPYGALLVFSLWFGLVDFFITPFGSWLSRRNEFAADTFARQQTGAKDLSEALMKLRESNHAMPLSHPLYSMVYYSHPPLLERLAALNA